MLKTTVAFAEKLLISLPMIIVIKVAEKV